MTTWRGLIRSVSRRYRSKRPSVPFGWIAARHWDANRWLVMPLWLYPVWYLWDNRTRLFFTPFMRLGVYAVDEGDYYVNGRWTWAQDWN